MVTTQRPSIRIRLLLPVLHMGEYRVRVDSRVHWSVRKGEVGSDLSQISSLESVQEALATDLFEKYRMNTARPTRTVERAPACLSGNERFFWRDDTRTQPIKTSLIESRDSGRVEREVQSVYIQIERVKPSAEEAGRASLAVDKLQYCQLTGKPFDGLYYAFLMSHPLLGMKKDTNIGISKNPIQSVIAHNNQAELIPGSGGRRGDVPVSGGAAPQPLIIDKDTASAAPHWILDTALGPFFTQRRAIECCQEWLRRTRGISSKRKKAYVLAKRYQCQLYSSRLPIQKPLMNYLSETKAPPIYLESCRQIKARQQKERSSARSESGGKGKRKRRAPEKR